jgi:hypothetical protein
MMRRLFLAVCLIAGLWLAVPSPASAVSSSEIQTASASRPSEEALKQWRQLSPAERERLQSLYNRFREMPEDQQDLLRQRLEQFRQLPPEEQARLQENFKRWQNLSAGEKKKLRQTYRRFRDLPPDQQQKMREEMRQMQNLPTMERQQMRQQMYQRNFGGSSGMGHR